MRNEEQKYIVWWPIGYFDDENEIVNYKAYELTIEELHKFIVKNLHNIYKEDNKFYIGYCFKSENNLSDEEIKTGIPNRWGSSTQTAKLTNTMDLKYTLKEIANIPFLLNFVIYLKNIR